MDVRKICGLAAQSHGGMSCQGNVLRDLHNLPIIAAEDGCLRLHDIDDGTIMESYERIKNTL
jgi:hypothetical protein